MSSRTRSEHRLAWMLCAPAVLVMLLVTAYPILYAFVLSLQDVDLRFPEDGGFVGLDNYKTVLTSDLWWQDLFNTAFLTVVSVAIELALGMAIALVMYRAIFARGVVRTAVLIPYGIVTVVAAFAWQFAFDPASGFVNGLPLIADDKAWFGDRFSAFAVIIMAEVWKTTPFMALLLLAGLTTIDTGLYEAAKVDGASAWKRFTQDHAAAGQAGDPGRAALPHARRLPNLRHDLHHDPRLAGHRVCVHPRIQPADLAPQPRAWLGGLGADLLLRPDHCVLLRAVPRGPRQRGEAGHMRLHRGPDHRPSPCREVAT